MLFPEVSGEVWGQCSAPPRLLGEPPRSQSPIACRRCCNPACQFSLQSDLCLESKVREERTQGVHTHTHTALNYIFTHLKSLTSKLWKWHYIKKRHFLCLAGISYHIKQQNRATLSFLSLSLCIFGEKIKIIRRSQLFVCFDRSIISYCIPVGWSRPKASPVSSPRDGRLWSWRWEPAGKRCCCITLQDTSRGDCFHGPVTKGNLQKF